MESAFEIIVVGGGHAGAEAALAAARMGCRTALVTHERESISRMSCNPALGGLGKGHLIRELDALGGAMGLAADATGIHFRRLNTRKGAAVRGTRCQSDKAAYSAWMQAVLLQQPGLTLIYQEASALLLSAGELRGIRLEDGSELSARTIVLTTGTFLAATMHCGDGRRPGGREGGRSALGLSESLAGLGLPLGRLKTGTPCRLDGRTLDYERMERQPGDQPAPRLSAWSAWSQGRPPLRQLDCHITHTNEQTHELIRANLHRSAIYSGAISASGPRYCPSIEDKVVRFAERGRHQIFVEPEGISTVEVYPNGISTSLPAEVQAGLIATIVGFERAKIVRYGYAVEYDFVDPRALDHSLELKVLPGLFLAGQINGTTGYEEAAAQGLLAAINAVARVRERAPLILRRDQAYIGVLIDDLVTRGVGGEPYRLFTSRAEYRLLLREDNACARLTPLGRELGLIDDLRWARFAQREDRARVLRDHLEGERVPGGERLDHLDRLLSAAGTSAARSGMGLVELLRRPEVTIALLQEAGLAPAVDAALAEGVEIDLKYAPYIERQREQALRLAAQYALPLPADFDYLALKGLSNEAREKLSRLRPRSLAQAAQIPGMTPAALGLLEVHLRLRQTRREHAEPRELPAG